MSDDLRRARILVLATPLDWMAPAHGAGMLALSIVLAVGGFIVLLLTEWWLAPVRPDPAEHQGPIRRDPPAVVNLLTNDVTVTAAAYRATVIDLAARGWLRILPPDGDDELGRVRPSAVAHGGDALLPHERLVLQHVLARFTDDDAIPARYLAVDVKGSWWRRFRGLIADEARRTGLVRRRWTPIYLIAPMAMAVFSVLAWFAARNDSDSTTAVIDSLERRVIAVVTLLFVGALIARIVGHATRGALTHTQAGLAATKRWLATRQRLVEAGFAPMAPSSLETGDRRLAYATAMCLADGAAIELPLAREDHYRAWSAVGARGRLVRVRYPWRPGYGLHPLAAIVIGGLALVLGVRGKNWFSDVAREEAWLSLYDRFPDQDWLIADVATGIAVVCFVPIALGAWMTAAGLIDLFASVERTGVVVRARRPSEVSPLPLFIRRLIERDRYSVFIAIDDGSRSRVVAWRCTERTAVPQGARAVVRASPVLGYVRRSTPVGHVLPN